ncbi:hypothetical protein IFM89_029490 [Coptis chinensis]|uniref:DUF4283 domain-containing protein n=1 Tax=Coptis chinensis TaxID=261450 RepID=A0A835HY70_9MAGN|nr:hypothetical protein IFM89_029490 [Coptis chinensis]
MVADKVLFYFKFGCEEDRQMVIEQGPIFVVGRVFVIRPWADDLDSQRKGIQKVPVWVKMDLPKILWTDKGISFVAGRLGKPLCVDAATANRTRLNYAKVCIEVDASSFGHSSEKCNKGQCRTCQPRQQHRDNPARSQDMEGEGSTCSVDQENLYSPRNIEAVSTAMVRYVGTASREDIDITPIVVVGPITNSMVNTNGQDAAIFVA